MQQNKWCIARDWLLCETDRVRQPSINLGTDFARKKRERLRGAR
jgi:hypothetical protein